MIAIIALLAAILFPVFARARENARRSSCLSNIKQIGLGALQYTQDCDERVVLQGVNGTPISYWFTRLQPYLKGDQILFCPSDDGVNPRNPPWSNNLSYCSNFYYMTIAYHVSGVGPTVSLADIPDAAGTVSFAEKNGWNCRAAPGSSSLPLARHLEGGNFVFMDGHAKWYPETNTIFRTPTLWDRT